MGRKKNPQSKPKQQTNNIHHHKDKDKSPSKSSTPSSPTLSDPDPNSTPTSPHMDTRPHLMEQKEQDSPRVRASPKKKISDVIEPMHAWEEKQKTKVEQDNGQEEIITTTSRPKLVSPPPTREPDTDTHEQAIPQQQQQQQQQLHVEAHSEKKESNMEAKKQVTYKSSALEEMGLIRRIIVSFLVIAFAASTATTDLGLSLLTSFSHRIFTFIFGVVCGNDNVFWKQLQQQNDNAHGTESGLTPSWFSARYITFRVGLVIKHIDRLIYELITSSRVAAARSLIPTLYIRVLSFLCPSDAHDLLYKHQLEQMHETETFQWKHVATMIHVMTPRPTCHLPMPKPMSACI